MRQAVRRIYNEITARQRNKVLDQKMLGLSVPLSSKHLEHCRVFPDRRSLIASFPKNAVVAEVGVAMGDFSADILETANPRLFYLIDAWAMDGHSNYGEEGYKKVAGRFNEEIKTGKVEIRRGYSHERLTELEDDSLDWIYIDAAHDYQSVRGDLDIALLKVGNGGIISGHDYCRWGKNGKRFGVLEAVNEFCVRNDLSFIGISLENNLNWSYALRVVR